MSRGSLFSQIERLEQRFARPPKPVPPPPARLAPGRDQGTTLAAPAAAVAAVAKLPQKTQPPVVVPPPAPPPPVHDRLRGRLNLSARAVKVSLTLDPTEIAEIGSLAGSPPLELRIAAGGRVVRGQVKAKGLRLALALIAEHGAENVVVILSGRLARDDKGRDVLTEAGLVAKAKAAQAQPQNGDYQIDRL